MRSPLLMSGMLLSSFAFHTSTAVAAEKIVTVYSVSESGTGNSIGTILFKDSDQGLEIKPKLTGLIAGTHGFHLHENPSCDAAEKDGKMTPAQAAGGHYDPAKTGKHAGPTGNGHHGDLPALEVSADGTTQKTLLAPHLTLADISGRAVMVHEGGDNYSDSPKPLGGGGGRIACGIIE